MEIELLEEIRLMNEKLDKIIELLNKQVSNSSPKYVRRGY